MPAVMLLCTSTGTSDGTKALLWKTGNSILIKFADTRAKQAALGQKWTDAGRNFPSCCKSFPLTHNRSSFFSKVLEQPVHLLSPPLPFRPSAK
jgi:hypothetical protein